MSDWVPGRHTRRKILTEGYGSVKQLAARNERAASFCVSSPKSVGEFGFREIAETAIQGDFNGFAGPTTIGFSGGQFHFFVEPGSYPSAFICFASLARTSSIALFIFCMMWKRSRTWIPDVLPSETRSASSSRTLWRLLFTGTASPCQPGTSERSSSTNSCRHTTGLAQPSHRTSGIELAAWH